MDTETLLLTLRIPQQNFHFSNWNFISYYRYNGSKLLEWIKQQLIISYKYDFMKSALLKKWAEKSLVLSSVISYLENENSNVRKNNTKTKNWPFITWEISTFSLQSSKVLEKRPSNTIQPFSCCQYNKIHIQRLIVTLKVNKVTLATHACRAEHVFIVNNM